MAKFVKIANLYLCVIIATLVACNHRSSEEKYIEIADSKKKAESISATETSVPKSVIVEIEPAIKDPSANAPIENAKHAYIFPNSSYDWLSYKKDLRNKTDEELRIGRNEIYARHGRRFADVSLQSYFDTKDWYQGTIEPKDFNYNNISRIEQINIDAIMQVEWQRRIAGDAKTYTYKYDRTEYSTGDIFIHPEYKEHFLNVASIDLDHILVKGQEIQEGAETKFTRSDLSYDAKINDYGYKLSSWICLSEHEASFCIDGNDCITYYTR